MRAGNIDRLVYSDGLCQPTSAEEAMDVEQ